MSKLGDRKISELRDFVPEIDPGLHRTAAFTLQELRTSGDKDSLFYMRGYGAVYDSWSLDLGGFRERLLPGAFDEVLSSDPHVLHVIDHDTSRVLSTTRNGTLTLTSDTHGLNFYSRVAKTSYAADLQVSLERRDIDQSSFAFTVGEDDWRYLEDEDIVERDVHRVKGLFDITTCAMGAYPATVSALAVRSLASGRSPEMVRAQLVAPALVGEPQEDAPDVPVVTPRASDADATQAVRELQAQADAAVLVAKERLFRGRTS